MLRATSDHLNVLLKMRVLASGFWLFKDLSDVLWMFLSLLLKVNFFDTNLHVCIFSGLVRLYKWRIFTFS